jgi:uracil-DNA glycosylase family 4
MPNENPDCQLCDLSTTCSPESRCLKGEGSLDAKLAIYLDAPTIVEDRRHKSFVAEAAEYLKWLLKRMSVSSADVYIDYVLKCYPKTNKNFGKKAYRGQMLEACSTYRVATLQLIKPLAIVAMGRTACEAFTGSQEIGEYEGARWVPTEPRIREIVDGVWVTYSPGYALESPAESVGIYRILFAAAEEAGLKPQLNKKVIPYDYGY